MEYTLEIWTIDQLQQHVQNQNLDLNPEYQRRFIWSLSDQQTLINSILTGKAIPNIFLFQKGNQFDVVDGQQRIRTILGYKQNLFKEPIFGNYNELTLDLKQKFDSYKFPVTIINNLDQGETIEDFYALVNSSGIHLNRPELKKAEYFDTNFLKLVNEAASYDDFVQLNLFTDAASKRMNDIDFVSELIGLLILGITDKKLGVDKLFEKDIDANDYKKYIARFQDLISLFKEFNRLTPIKQTRYKQRNDFYTLFDFYNSSLLSDNQWKIDTYKQLVTFSDHIVPANEKCEPFQEYAFHCISQSNSKNARDIRKSILTDIFKNKSSKPNKRQKAILKFYNYSTFDDALVKTGDFYLIKSDITNRSLQ